MDVPEELRTLAERVIEQNRTAGRRIVVAESCTGGLVSAAITSVAGCSDVFEAGFVTYANEAKIGMLGVSDDLLETFGAVSIATAWAMAQGALDRSSADIAVAITGVAGPNGGSADKPVGTVVFARARRGGKAEDVVADRRQFADEGRANIRIHAARCALELLLPETSP